METKEKTTEKQTNPSNNTPKPAVKVPEVHKVKVPNAVKTEINDCFSLLCPTSPAYDELKALCQDVVRHMTHDNAWITLLRVYRDERDRAVLLKDANYLCYIDFMHMATVYLMGYIAGVNQRKLTFHTVTC